MPKSTAKFSRGKSNQPEISLKQADDLIQAEHVRISRISQLLRSSFSLFKGKDTILPAQCKHVINDLEEIDDNIQEFLNTLHEIARLSSPYKVLQHRLTSCLYLIREQINEISENIENFRDVCMTTSPTARQQRRDIYMLIETVLIDLDEVSQKAASLNYESYRLQKKLYYAQQEDLCIN